MSEEAILKVPRGTKSGALALDTTRIIIAENRLEEVRRVTIATAPDLLACYNEAYLDLQKFLGALRLEHDKAVREANKRRSIVLLDEAPRILQEKGLATSKNPGGSADLRQAILDGDEEYCLLMDKADYIAAVHTMLAGRCKAIEMAFQAVKKIIERGQGNGLGRVSTSAGAMEVDIPSRSSRY